MTAQFELHRLTLSECTMNASDDDPWNVADATARAQAFVVHAGEGVLWPDLNVPQHHTLPPMEAGRFPLGLRVIRQAVGSKLLLLAPPGCLVNGTPALPVVVLQPRDLVGAPDGALYAVTERVTPHFGLALPEQLGLRCGLCKLPFDAESFVLSCRCGGVFHYESMETTPHKSAEDRADCAVNLKQCLICGQPLSTQPYLIWDPDAEI